jgi:hypothetical protein
MHRECGTLWLETITTFQCSIKSGPASPRPPAIALATGNIFPRVSTFIGPTVGITRIRQNNNFTLPGSNKQSPHYARRLFCIVDAPGALCYDCAAELGVRLMKIRFYAIAIFLMLICFSAVSSVSACELPDEGLPSRLQCGRLSARSLFQNPSVSVASDVASSPRGTSPNDAMSVPDAWQDMGPGDSVWYKTPYSENFRVLEFWLETNLPDVASFSIYSPDQTDGLSAATKPVGRGTHSKSDPDNVIRWKASYAKPGVWYIYLFNKTDKPISFKLNNNQQTTPVKKCISYWEYLPTGEYVLWTDCGFYTGPKD